MNTLILKNGALGANSATNEVLDHAIAALQAKGQTPTVHDLSANPLPHIHGGNLQSELSNTLIAEIKAQDVIVIGAPMYNFGIPSTLKSYLDHVLRAGETFRYTANGPEGLLTGKKAIVVMASGGKYDEAPAAAMDFVRPYLKTVLGFVGITDVQFVNVQGVAFGPEARTAAIEAAKQAVAAALA